jgi:hypothetical protein
VILEWSLSLLAAAAIDLATAADVGLWTIQEVEKVDGEPRVASTLQRRSDARNQA